MELLERDRFLEVLHSCHQRVLQGEGHCLFISGEAGIGKTSLVRAFTKELRDRYSVYQGSCDALFTPRPLAPLFDIIVQMGVRMPETSADVEDRTALFTRLFQELLSRKETCLLIFEDIHWADEATFDFIKFLARRITQLSCLFVLTYRDDDMLSQPALRNILGQLTPDTFTRVQLPRLSKEVVEELAVGRGYRGEDVYTITGGNPFYVTEILASYSLGIPDNIRDSIVAGYNRMDEGTKNIWQILSVVPTAFEVSYLERMEPGYAREIEACLNSKVLIIENGLIFFKHELYRRTIEEALSPLLRVKLNKKVLELFGESFERDHKIERIIHHAKNANEYEMVVKYAPIAARQAAALGAHTQAARLYLTAIDYYQGHDDDVLLGFYEPYAYECYLTYQIDEAIIYVGKAMQIWKKKGDHLKTGGCLRFLSRLWWLAGKRKKAERYGEEAIEFFRGKPASPAKAMAFSNMSQLKMLYHEPVQSIYWGEQAIAMAKDLNDAETLCHALNNVGTVRMWIHAEKKEGRAQLEQSLEIALKNSFHEHAARAYSNLCTNLITEKDYAAGMEMLEEGTRYCEERDLDSWQTYLMAWKSRALLETGHWEEAERIADCILKDGEHAPYVKVGVLLVSGTVKMRKGSMEEALPLLDEARVKAIETMELQRILPALTALLEYEWLTGQEMISSTDLENAVNLLLELPAYSEFSQFPYWLYKSRKRQLGISEIDRLHVITNAKEAKALAEKWEKLHCTYEQAMALSEGDEEDKRKAIALVRALGADAVYEKMKFDMRTAGIRSIPRGIRKSTQANPAQLTDRELDILQLLPEGLQNKEIAARLFISAKTVDHHISAILYKLEVKTRARAVQEAARLGILKIGNDAAINRE